MPMSYETMTWQEKAFYGGAIALAGVMWYRGRKAEAAEPEEALENAGTTPADFAQNLLTQVEEAQAKEDRAEMVQKAVTYGGWAAAAVLSYLHFVAPKLKK